MSDMQAGLEETTEALMQCKRERDELAFWIDEVASKFRAGYCDRATVDAAQAASDRIRHDHDEPHRNMKRAARLHDAFVKRYEAGEE